METTIPIDSQHAYVYIHDLAREALAAAAEVHKGGGKTREAGQALRRLRSWEFLQSLQVRGEGRGREKSEVPGSEVFA